MTPEKIKLHRQSQQLELTFNGQNYSLSAEFLRVMSPSAEVKGHGPGQEVLQHGKQDVKINGIEACGNYAVKLIFSDGHDSGIYSWNLLHEMCVQQQTLWQSYLDKLEAAGVSRDPNTQVVRFIP